MTREEAHAKVGEWINDTSGKSREAVNWHYGKAEMHRDITRIFDSIEGKPERNWCFDEMHGRYLPVDESEECVKVTDKNGVRIMTTKRYLHLCDEGKIKNPIILSRITK